VLSYQYLWWIYVSCVFSCVHGSTRLFSKTNDNSKLCFCNKGDIKSFFLSTGRLRTKASFHRCLRRRRLPAARSVSDPKELQPNVRARNPHSPCLRLPDMNGVLTVGLCPILCLGRPFSHPTPLGLGRTLALSQVMIFSQREDNFSSFLKVIQSLFRLTWNWGCWNLKLLASSGILFAVFLASDSISAAKITADLLWYCHIHCLLNSN